MKIREDYERVGWRKLVHWVNADPQEDYLTKEEIKRVKKLAQSLLTTIKGRIHELDHWREKEETRSNISILIRDMLWAELPESYDDVEITRYRERIFEYVYTAYPAA